LVASKIIELAQSGVLDAARLRSMTRKEHQPMSNLWPPAVDQKAWCFRLENSSAQQSEACQVRNLTHWFEASQNVCRGIGKE
jgi:hypothetical protein